MQKKVFARIKGGLGNQLFCYAAARRLAIANDAELIVDDVSGFARDSQYRRRCELDHFNIEARRALPGERLEPFERYRRALLKWRSRSKPFLERSYIEQEGIDFDSRLLAFRVKKTVYLDGLWQSEGYFKDVEAIIRRDLQIIPPQDALNQSIAAEILRSDAVAVHMRWFDDPAGAARGYNVANGYYRRAMDHIEATVGTPRYFLFSDDPQAAIAALPFEGRKVTVVAHNRAADAGYADLWLMALCKHFIAANSTFSWWGAWLSHHPSKCVVVPSVKLEGKAAWGFSGLLPPEWTQL